ncbi:hypothetical protein P3H15_44990 [Rhodococcus sp. T2V]|uniref:hypothetical protein n=1 Tax=Rhodococcus sp. T2V TaxID=3034164 RepID=UPI0023E342E2|nr:hypothetical protein [Rhodococcus sp. T2V]MDF3312133.1 hypothetical protein [Rhodococcus sp. T2V]
MTSTSRTPLQWLSARYERIAQLIPELWGYPLFCWVLRHITTVEKRAPYRPTIDPATTERKPVSLA